MAGSGIRYWNLAAILGRQQRVTLAIPNEAEMKPPPGVDIVTYGPGDWVERGHRQAELVTQHDIILCQIPPYAFTPEEVLAERHMVIDLYAPWFLEKLEYARVDPERGIPNRQDDMQILQRVMALGDFYICASERQRDFWLGALTMAGRLDPQRQSADPELRSLIDVVPFGLPTGRPIPHGPGPRQAFPQIGARDPLVLWNGGIWNWLDPFTAIQATHLLVEKGIPCRLVFMGIKNPGAEIAEMESAERAMNLARELGLLDSHVFFNDWVPYEDRQNWLMQATLTLSLHQPTIEARFAFRTRVLDNLWCRVPLIATEGDVLADMVADEGLGATVPPGNPVAVAAAIERVSATERQHELRQRLATVAQRYTWEQVAEPLAAYCADPWKHRAGREQSDYVQRIERLYAETAEYARHLEATLAEREREARKLAAERGWRDRLRAWRLRA